MLLFDFTQEERQRIKDFQAPYIAQFSKMDIRELKELNEEFARANEAFIEAILDERFKRITDQGTEAIVESALEEIEYHLTTLYQHVTASYAQYMSEAEPEVKAIFFGICVEYGTRVVDNDTVFIDNDYARRSIIAEGIQRHIKALQGDKKSLQKIEKAIDDALDRSEYTSDSLGVLLKKPHVERTDDNYFTAFRVTKRVTMIDKLTTDLFNNSDSFIGGKQVLLSGKKRKKVFVYGNIDFTPLIEQGLALYAPQLNDDDKAIHEALVSHWAEGCFVLSAKMVYRFIIGSDTDNIKVPDEWRAKIKEALSKFKATIDVEYSKIDKDGNEKKIVLHKPIISFIVGEGYLNGAWMDDLIILSRDERFMPPLLEWAIFNGREIDSRNAALMKIKGLQFTRDNQALKQALYDIVIRRANENRRKQERLKAAAEKEHRIYIPEEIPLNRRTIRFDSIVYPAVGYDGFDFDENGERYELSNEAKKQRRKRIKQDVDSIFKEWRKKGLITGYEAIREGRKGYTKVSYTFT